MEEGRAAHGKGKIDYCRLKSTNSIFFLDDAIRVEEFHISVPLTVSSVVNLTRINNEFYVGPYRTEKTDIFLHTSEVDSLPLSSLPRLPKALSNGLNFFLEKKNLLFSITDDIFLEGTNTTQGMKLHSRKWEIQLSSAKKQCCFSKKLRIKWSSPGARGLKKLPWSKTWRQKWLALRMGERRY